MKLCGFNLIGSDTVAGATTFHGVNPATSQPLQPAFHEAGDAEAARALEAAESAFEPYRLAPAAQRAAFLNAIAAAIAADDDVLQRAHEETALPPQRLLGERGRTVNQLHLFAKVVEEGSWVAARIDHGDPLRQPAPKPDLRRMLIPLGPVVVFAASNFPLAFSVAGGDTASALAAGCPVVVKAHPAHPGTSEIIGRHIVEAAKKTGMPPGVFSLLHGRSNELGAALVRHPLTRAAGFTGSLRAGRALFDLAAARPEPIPVYAEMGSTNPIFLLPGALAERGRQIAEGLRNSVTMGVGQFCTKPGLVVAIGDDAARQFVSQLGSLMADASPGTMLYGGLRDSYVRGAQAYAAVDGVEIAARSSQSVDSQKTQAAPMLFAAGAKAYLEHSALRQELFGPATLLVTGTQRDVMQIAATLEGHLTATIHGTPRDLEDHRDLLRILERKVGRLLFNGFPTGVEVSPAMQHGGPYPATTDSRTTSVGTAAIERFARPVCYQDFPPEALPQELQDQNPRNIRRMEDGQWTQSRLAAQ